MAIGIILMLIECVLILWVVSFEAFVYTISPLNVRNWICAILILLPGFLLIRLAVAVANRKRQRAKIAP